MNKSFTAIAHATSFCPYLTWITSFCNPLPLYLDYLKYPSIFQLSILKQLDYLSCIYPASSLMYFVLNLYLEPEHLFPQRWHHLLSHSLVSQKTHVTLYLVSQVLYFTGCIIPQTICGVIMGNLDFTALANSLPTVLATQNKNKSLP